MELHSNTSGYLIGFTGQQVQELQVRLHSNVIKTQGRPL